MSKTEKQDGHHTLLDNEQIRMGIRRYLAGQELGTISPKSMVEHLAKAILPVLGFTDPDLGITE